MLYCRCEKIYTELLKNIFSKIFENSFWLKHYSFKDVRVYFIVELIFSNLQKLFDSLYILYL